MASIFGENTGLDNQLNDLFKNSAGPSSIAVAPKPISQNEVSKLLTGKLSKRKQQKLMIQRAEAGAAKARVLSALPELRKRKADVLENDQEQEEKSNEEGVNTTKSDETPKKKTKAERKEEDKKKNERSIFVGNVPVECMEKTGLKEFKQKFTEFGIIESVRFRSVAFAEQTSRKAAFIKKKLHDKRSVANAYIVYQDKESVEKALQMNGQVFKDKHLRVDSAINPKSHDRKRSVFVGSLPFDAEEEELWEFFKDCGEIESVRIVRDKTTNIGKGIAYVQFKRRNIVDMALALDDKKFRVKHTLRIQRCKSEDEITKAQQQEANKKTKGATGGGKGGRFSKSKTVSKKPLGKNSSLLSNKFEGARASKASGNKFKTGKTTKALKQKPRRK
ncbi:hypothetical protein INT45_003573 [Circinella minor]|uniref:Nucleolar protein 12 n=1 Tax=Circinella minor TaxID=1195481 RepID=A0A8H7VP52_9FUNG|nr:hypothetical protein INT45_003573 [Circinella minor]